MSMITPFFTDATSPGMTDGDLPVFHVCPSCGASALSGKSARYATAWELVHGRGYPNIDYSIPCFRHEVA